MLNQFILDAAIKAEKFYDLARKMDFFILFLFLDYTQQYSGVVLGDVGDCMGCLWSNWGWSYTRQTNSLCYCSSPKRWRFYILESIMTLLMPTLWQSYGLALTHSLYHNLWVTLSEIDGVVNTSSGMAGDIQVNIVAEYRVFSEKISIWM